MNGFKKARVLAGLNASDVAKKIDCHINTVYRWENDTNTPTVGQLIELTKLYECSSDFLLGLTNDHRR